MFDFLKEIVESVPDPSAGGTIDLDADRGGEGAKRKRGGKTKKNGAASGATSSEAPKRRRKRKPADTESADPGGSKSDVEGDVAMEEDGDGEGGKLNRHYRDNDWQDDDDTS